MYGEALTDTVASSPTVRKPFVSFRTYPESKTDQKSTLNFILNIICVIDTP